VDTEGCGRAPGYQSSGSKLQDKKAWHHPPALAKEQMRFDLPQKEIPSDSL